jgi:Uncharacterized conserved protein
VTPPSRTLGIAFSDDDRTSRLAGAVVRADGTLDGLGFETCTVGGTDATDAAIALFDRLRREDVRHVAVAGIAPRGSTSSTCRGFTRLSTDRCTP